MRAFLLRLTHDFLAAKRVQLLAILRGLATLNFSRRPPGTQKVPPHRTMLTLQVPQRSNTLNTRTEPLAAKVDSSYARRLLTLTHKPVVPLRAHGKQPQALEDISTCNQGNIEARS